VPSIRTRRESGLAVIHDRISREGCQIRTVIRTFRDRIFPGRSEVPKTLIFANDDSHADDIVQIVREEFGKGNDFCQKITYKTATARIPVTTIDAEGREVERFVHKSSGLKPEDLLASVRNAYNPRIVVTVDMIATGTDIRPLEVVMFMRSVKSRTFFEQIGLGAGRALLGRDPAGRWAYIAGGQNPVPYQAELPGPLTVCAEGSTLNVRSEPSIDAPVLFTLTDGAAVTAEYFTLTQPGAFPGGERGAGWYYLGAPVEGWSYSGYLAPPLGPAGPPACALL
jgi:hypothetical protein